MKFNFEFYQEGPNQCMVRRRSHDDYNGCGMFSVSEEFGAEICKRWNGYAAMTAERDALREELRRNDHDIVVMTAAKDKAVNMLKCTDDGPRTRECYSAVTGRDYEADMAELEEVK